MEKVKIRIETPSGYVGWEEINFPIEVEAEHRDGIYFVTKEEMAKHEGYFFSEEDLGRNSTCRYILFSDEVIPYIEFNNKEERKATLLRLIKFYGANRSEAMWGEICKMVKEGV